MINLIEEMIAEVRQGKAEGTIEVELSFNEISRTMIVDYKKLVEEFLEEESPRFAIESGMLEEIYKKYGNT